MTNMEHRDRLVGHIIEGMLSARTDVLDVDLTHTAAQAINLAGNIARACGHRESMTMTVLQLETIMRADVALPSEEKP